MFLNCALNNRAETVLQQFQLAVSTFGLPTRIQTDKGGENVGICCTCMTVPLQLLQDLPHTMRELNDCGGTCTGV